MTAISRARPTKQMQGYPFPAALSYGVAADEVLYQGTLVILKDGYAYAGQAMTGGMAIGLADPNQPDQDNTGGADGDLIANIVPGCFRWENSALTDAIAVADIGTLCYVVDNQTVAKTSGSSTRSAAGTVVAVDDAGVWVYSNLMADLDGGALAAEIAARQAFEAALANTTTGTGASLVGIQDSGSLFAAATVEAALAEAIQTALQKPVTFPVVLATAVSGATLYRLKAPYAGKLLRMDCVATAVVTAAAKAAVLKAQISGTDVTSMTLTLASASLLTLGNRVSGTTATAALTVAAGQEISVLVSSASAPFTEGELDIQLFFGPQ